jgi:hypothetical protein
MGKRKDGSQTEKALAAVEVSQQITIRGGFSEKHFVIQTRDFSFDGANKACVPVSHTEPWLCEMATGSCVYQRPMCRSRILKMLKDQLIAKCGPETVNEKMQDLAFDDDGDDPASPLHTPVKGQGPRTRARKKESASAWRRKPSHP